MINTNRVSFKSRINIVTEKTFRKLPRGVFINYYADKRNSNIVKAANFSTYGIRTCTGGGLMSRFDNAALGFHIWDETTNIPDILMYIRKQIFCPDCGLLIGSKKLYDSPNSVKIFERMKKSLMEVCPNISYFKTFTNDYARADFKYSREQDCWNIKLTSYNEATERDVPVFSLNTLLKFFEEISIAPSDLLFINGKLIKREQAPQIFR